MAGAALRSCKDKSPLRLGDGAPKFPRGFQPFGDDYLDRCDLEPIEDPAQAWNALTVGAHTELTALDPNEPGYDGWMPLAEHGELSPYSRTSVSCNSAWPVKPDVLLEG